MHGDRCPPRRNPQIGELRVREAGSRPSSVPEPCTPPPPGFAFEPSSFVMLAGVPAISVDITQEATIYRVPKARDRMPEDEAENAALGADLIRGCSRDTDGLRVDHFSHHAAGAVRRAHQNRV